MYHCRRLQQLSLTAVVFTQNTDARQVVVELQGQPRNQAAVRHVGVQKRSPRPDLLEGSAPSFGSARQPLAPHLPSRCPFLPFHLTAILLNPRLALDGNALPPAVLSLRGIEHAQALYSLEQYVQIVDLAQCVLNALQPSRPLQMLFGKKVLHHIAKLLQPDSQPMKGVRACGLQCRAFQPAGLGPSLQGQGLEWLAAQPQASRPPR